MAEAGTSNLGFQLDVDQILAEAQHRWLKTAEIAEVLKNYNQFHISTEAPNKPECGSVFLFNRKVLLYFREDGHIWRKTKDGSTIKEAHEKLKVGNVDMLSCYYAHSEDYEYFQRCSLWLLEQDLTHMVLVHYLQAKGNKTTLSTCRNGDTVVSNSCVNLSSLQNTLSSSNVDAESGKACASSSNEFCTTSLYSNAFLIKQKGNNRRRVGNKKQSFGC